MARLRPVSWREFVERLHELGFEGPFSGGRHPQMRRGDVTLNIPNPHDEDGFYVGEVPQLKACYSQGRTIDELMANMRDVIALCLEEEPDYTPTEFVGVQRVLA